MVHKVTCTSSLPKRSKPLVPLTLQCAISAETFATISIGIRKFKIRPVWTRIKNLFIKPWRGWLVPIWYARSVMILTIIQRYWQRKILKDPACRVSWPCRRWSRAIRTKAMTRRTQSGRMKKWCCWWMLLLSIKMIGLRSQSSCQEELLNSVYLSSWSFLWQRICSRKFQAVQRHKLILIFNLANRPVRAWWWTLPTRCSRKWLFLPGALKKEKSELKKNCKNINSRY